MSSSGGSHGGASLSWPLALGTDESFQPTGVASNALTLHNPAAAVNGLTLNGSATGAAVSLGPSGTDANIGVNLTTKGTGALLLNGAAGAAGQFLQSNGAGAAPTWGTAAGVSWPLTNAGDETFQPNGIATNTLTLHNNAAAVNGLQVTGTATGAPPTIAPVGPDANIGLAITNKGTGVITLQNQDSSSSVSVGIASSPCRFSSAGLLVGGNPDNAVYAYNLKLKATSGSLLMLQTDQNGTRPMLTLAPTAGAWNSVTITTGDTTNAPSIAATGGDVNVDLTLHGAGTGVINFGYAATALGGGAAPTLGTIGGSGPAAAAQNSWLAIKINGTASFLPVWR